VKFSGNEMKSCFRTYIIAAASCLLLNGCHKNKDVEEQRYTWSTDAPLTIPYRTRLQRLGKNNLLRNFSFETGRTFTLDSSTTSFVVDGWQQVGRHVEWVDIRNDSLYKPDEVFTGNRAIKIVRKTAYEIDAQGEGILSDFIKVIPGNYSLSLYARLENVFPLKARLGTKMYDGVDISLQFFDRNKIPIKPNFRFPRINQIIDASFKALSFANFSEIRSFGWGKVIGKSHHFPFPEGDIPSDAHYVKVFIGLKGTGTMWIDSITFKYTDRNFSVAERMQKFTDTTFLTLEALIPRPKKVTKMESVIFCKPGKKADKLPVIVIPDNADVIVMNAARLIQGALQNSIAQSGNCGKNIPVIRIVKERFKNHTGDSILIISLGKTALYNNYQEILPQHEIVNHPQGYFIFTPGDLPNLIIIGANNSTGLYYAALTAVQMIDDQAPVFHNARIVDYPDFPNRFYAIEVLKDADEANQQGEFARELISYKLNGAFSISAADQSAFFDENVDSLSSLAGNDLFSIIHMPRYLPPDDSTLTYRYPIRIARKKGTSVYDLTSLLPFEISGYKAYSHFIIPPVFHNQMLDNSDYTEMPYQAGTEVKCVYSGSSFFSLLTDDVDIERYTSFMGPGPVFMDNSMLISSRWGQFGGSDQYYPGKIRLFNIFEPFMNTEISEHFSKLDSTLFLVNQPVNTEIEVIRLATAADFLWNARTYSKDYSLWKVLMSRYGVDNARELIIFADKYGLMLEVILKLEMKSQIARNIKSGQQVMAELTSLVAKISENLGSQHNLVKELQLLNAGLRNRFNLHPSLTVLKN
jgi:hypothetical protein